MKKWLALLLIGVIVLSMTACGQKKERGKTAANEENLSSLEAIQKRGKLVVGTSADSIPSEFHILRNGKDEIVGADIFLAQQIADGLGVALEIKDMNFDQLLANLDEGKFDMALASLIMTPPRKDAVDFSIPYDFKDLAILIPKDQISTFQSWNDLSGKKCGVQKGTSQEEIANSIENGMVIDLMKELDLVTALKNGTIDFAITDLEAARRDVKANRDLAIANIVVNQKQEIGAAFQKGNSKLKEEVDKILVQLLNEGKIQENLIKAKALAEAYKVE